MTELETLRKEVEALRVENVELKDTLSEVRTLAQRLRDRLDEYAEINRTVRDAYEEKIRGLSNGGL
jgi:predicted  nucleic acid-binding Zn-ribbon protein